MKNHWFRKVRGSYLPSNWIGIGLYLGYAAYLVVMAWDWYRLGHSGWQMLVHVIPAALIATAVMQAIASNKS